MQIQSNLASTIAMAFDECPPHPATREYMQNSVDRTTRWLHRCKAEMTRLNGLEDTINKHQMLFGINQGSTFDDLRIEHMKQIGATIIVRGLRAVTDFEYELQIAQTNHVENPEVETIFLTTSLQYSYLSSTIVKEFASYGGDISKFVPAQFIDRIYAKYNISK